MHSNNEYNGGGLFLRVYWSGLAPCLWVCCLIPMRAAGHRWTLWDLAFWLTVGTMIGARYWEWIRGGATTLTSEPLTAPTLKRYALQTAVISALAGLLVKLVA